MFDAGIVDATKAVRNALVNAVSASNNLLGSDYVITLKRIGDE
jgi:chaperonin GroEL (HSP60 family)